MFSQNRKFTKFWLLPVLGLGVAGCATTQPSQQLMEARAAYEEAADGKAANLTPDRLLTAQQSLERAEQAYEKDPRSEEEESYAYIAERRAQEAMAYAQAAYARLRYEDAERQYKVLAKQAKEVLDEREQKLRGARQELTQVSQRANEQEQRYESELAEERAARREAEQAAALAIEELKAIAAVTKEARGTVVTLPGSVLFKSGSSDMLPAAKERLKSVADALKKVESKEKIVVEGHTDSRGSDGYNRRLSQSRADSVRSFLVSEGLEAEKLKAVGRGENDPVAPNDSSESRAINRRVEIIIPDQS